MYWVVALVAVLALAGAAVTVTTRLTSAGGSDAPAACDSQDEADDAAEGAVEEADTDDIEEECDDANEAEDGEEADDANEQQVPSGTLDDGADLLRQADITLEQAVLAAQDAATGDLGEVDLEQYQGKLVFNVDVGDHDVKVDASDGSVLAVDAED